MVFHADFEIYNENTELYDKDNVYKQNTFFISIFYDSSYKLLVKICYGVFLLRHLDEFRALYNRFKPIL